MTLSDWVVIGLASLAAVLLLASALKMNQLISTIPYITLRWYWRAIAIGITIIAITSTIVVAVITGFNLAGLSVALAVVVCSGAVILTLQTLLTIKSLQAVEAISKVDDVDIYDSLTSVHNRSYLEFRLDQEIARSQRYGAPLSVMAVDIAGFYSFADEFGHHAGDIAIARLAERLTDSLRETDVVARYRADTFIVILPDTPVANVTTLQTRLEQQLKQLTVLDSPVDDRDAVSISVNFGSANCQLSTIDSDELLVEALADLRGKRQNVSDYQISEAIRKTLPAESVELESV